VTQTQPSAADTADPPRPGRDYDEMVNGAGEIRAAWQPLIGALHAMPKGLVAERVARANTQYEDISIAYRVDADAPAAGSRRPFDVLPMLITADDWPRIEAGLAQRARLLDRLLADLYGPGRLISDGVLPAALAHANPRFLRPCVGAFPAEAQHLHAYAADLVRLPDGGWRVLADRLQAPAGIGFALQNRGILARTVPELFRAYMVHRIEPFFDMWRDALAALSPRRDGPTRIVVMTPGPFNPAFFEHVYLARQLGATLVEGADLTVRHDRVFVKTLGALQPVDVILRFMEDDYCDPLELRATSVLGVAGLLQAVRAGTVVVANALGSAVAETPALRPYLPRLSEALLGEPLALPSVDTNWLGAPGNSDLAARLAAGEILRPAFATRREEQAFGEDLDGPNREALLDDARRRPHLYVSEPPLDSSVIPVWTPDGLEPQPLTLRVFLIRYGNEYHAMPGGFAQVPHRTAGAVARLNQPAMSKDTWVLVGENECALPTQRSAASGAPVRRPVDELRSRTADDLFWLGRYMERLDTAARLLRSAAMRAAVDSFGTGQRHELHSLARLLVDAHLLDRGSGELMPDSAGLMMALNAAGTRGRALDELFRTAQRIAQALRDRLSNDMWGVVIGNLRTARERIEARIGDIDGLIAAFDNLVGVVAAFNGMAAENMTRGSGWRFLDIGRRLERGVYASSVLKEALAGRREDAETVLHLALELCDSSITYRSRYLTAVQTAPVVDLILADETNPRGVAFQVQAIIMHLHELARSFDRAGDRTEQRQADRMLSLVRTVKLDGLDNPADPQARDRLAEVMDDLQRQMLALSDAITRAYFSHVRSPYTVGYGLARL
jgi:uncharacterized circularly permuted ATP-grasp superfamily protein/uncharacterized alpha-E superfamily protein